MFEFDPTNGANWRDEDGRLVWASSRQQAFITDYATGSFTVPKFADNAVTNSKVTQTLKSVSPLATHVEGSFTSNIVTQTGAGSTANAVYEIGGTVLLGARDYAMLGDSLNPTYTVHSTGPMLFAAVLALTFSVSGGVLRVEIERYSPSFAENQGGRILSTNLTVTYQAFALTFDN